MLQTILLSFDGVNFCFSCSSTLDGISFSLCGGLVQDCHRRCVCVYVSSITYMYVLVYVIIAEVHVVVASTHSANRSRHVIWHYVCPDIQWNGILIFTVLVAVSRMPTPTYTVAYI